MVVLLVSAARNRRTIGRGINERILAAHWRLMALASDIDGVVSFASFEAVLALPPPAPPPSAGVGNVGGCADADGVGDWAADARFTFVPCDGADAVLVNEKSVVLDARRRRGSKVGVRI